MTVEKRLSFSLFDITAIQFRCKCGSFTSQTQSSVVYKCGGCGAEWRNPEHQEYMLAVANFLTALKRLKTGTPGDPDLKIRLEFLEEGLG